VGRGIGPALEAHDVLAVLRGEAHAPADLKARSVMMAGELLEFCGSCLPGTGRDVALRLLESGAAWAKFQAICEAQGGMRMPGVAQQRQVIEAPVAGRVTGVDSRLLARAAKLAGAPGVRTAGIELHVKLGSKVARGEPLFTLHAEAPGELEYALQYIETHPAIDIAHDRNA
jgi:thymidine phosphorylase